MPCRKAMPPTAFVVPTQVSAGRLLTEVSFEDANGVPPCAILVPVARAQHTWCLADALGQPITQPVPNDLTARAEMLPPPGADFPPTVVIELPWPVGLAPYALLLLFFDQIEGVGDGDFGLHIAEAFGPARPRLVRSGRPIGDPCTDPDVAFAQVVRALLRLPLATLGNGMLPRPAVGAGIPLAATPVAPPMAAAGFCLASCQYPAGMLDGAGRAQHWELGDTDLGPAGQSLWRLSERLSNEPDLAFTLLAGDQVYVDATAGLFDAANRLDPFSFAYARMAEHPGMRRLTTRNRPVLPLMDDHEVSDNWEPAPAVSAVTNTRATSAPARHASLIDEAKVWYLTRQRRMWPVPRPASLAASPLFDLRRLGGFDFFLADTRTERSGRNIGNWRVASIMGLAQADALQAWISARKADSPPAFVVSGAMVFPRPLGLADQPAMALHLDAWAGHPASLHALLAAVFHARAGRIVFLSGDEHIPSVATVRLSCPAVSKAVVTVYSVHSSALYAPYPFANAVKADFAGSETFCFQHPAIGPARQFHGEVSTWFPDTGDGFAALYPTLLNDGRWQLRVAFEGQRGQAEKTLPL